VKMIMNWYMNFMRFGIIWIRAVWWRLGTMHSRYVRKHLIYSATVLWIWRPVPR
jgi:speA: arginine decarboxylase